MTAGDPQRHRADFRRLWAADALSQVGGQVSVLALPLAAVQATHASTLQVAILPALQTVAFLVLGLPAGVWSDRVRRRPLIISADLGRLVLLGSIPVAALLGVLTIWQLYVVALSVGVFTVFFDVAFQSYVPAVVDRKSLVKANSRLEVNRTVAAAAGPAMAGYLVQWLTAPIAIAVNAVTFAWSAAWVSTIGTKEPKPAPAPGVKLRRQVAEGIRFIFGHPTLRVIASYNGTAMTFYSAQGAVEVVFLLRELHVSPATTGLLFAGGSAASLLGAVCADRMTRAIGRHRALPLFTTLAGLGALLLPLTDGGWRLALFSLGSAISGFCLIAYNVVQISFRQSVCPDHLLGRMSATMRTVTLGVTAFGAILGGLLGTWFGVRTALWITAVGALAASLWFARMPRAGTPDAVAGGPSTDRLPAPSAPGRP
ncbi:putative MFS family arabinose efflux permease [Krasilnikovia cinnamomea]|uniref:Putative MFS family arabinose efflux permease n=1 Tax=Krasilnikovia cinnamomea TaxID=349313 RepID=A0A4V6MG49_9ACTN|nr:MFS transporter [Krasilnikovia cinnamomea]RZU51346.1 putative MFS family arabinose efflux permease [Krasilnikovia cinnamomea]